MQKFLLIIIAGSIIFTLINITDIYSKWLANPYLLSLINFKKKSSIANSVLINLKKFKSPQRVEVEVFTSKFSKEIEEIKKMKIPLNNQATHYISIEFFSDDSDAKAPMIIQFKIKNISNDQLITEKSIQINQ